MPPLTEQVGIPPGDGSPGVYLCIHTGPGIEPLTGRMGYFSGHLPCPLGSFLPPYILLFL